MGCFMCCGKTWITRHADGGEKADAGGLFATWTYVDVWALLSPRVMSGSMVLPQSESVWTSTLSMLWPVLLPKAARMPSMSGLPPVALSESMALQQKKALSRCLRFLLQLKVM